MVTADPLLTPMHGDVFQNPSPFPPLPLRPLRAGRIKKLWNKGIETAIVKVPIPGPAIIGPQGIEIDEHAWHDHGTPDKAILHYCSAHYQCWKDELPKSAHLFNVGGFGENICSEEIDERTMCIGDKVQVGEVLLQVTEPRNPCYKLNHRFETKDMAKRAQTLFRTGWMYRVLRTGTIYPTDVITLVDRPYPQWTVARVMHYMYNERNNKERMRECLAIPALGETPVATFKARLENGVAEDESQRMVGGEEVSMDSWNEYRIVEKRRETSKVTAFVLEATEQPDHVDPVEPGSHVRLKLSGKLVRAYSVVGGTSARFELGIALDAQSRGGSKFLHQQTKVGDILTVGHISASFPLAKDANRHIIIAGGIGITAFLAALQHLAATMKPNFYELHFAVAEEVPFRAAIAALGCNANIYIKSKGQKLDLASVFSRADVTTHIYCCGPQRLMDGVSACATKFSIPSEHVHFEQFAVSTSGDPFTAKLRESKKTVEVGATQTLLEVLREVGLDIDSSCEVGNCGTCRVGICSGRIEHRGTGLLDSEKDKEMLACVSRGVGEIVLDL